MNAMWGAGQMMFNKILIVADQDSDIKDYWAFAKSVSDLVNPLTDIHFSQGPMDVLDHSSSQFAYGSKLGIDATTKYKEEQDGIIQPDQRVIDLENVAKKLCEINGVVSANLNLLGKGISAIVLGITKDSPESLTLIINDILSINEIWGVKLIAYVDSGLDIYDIDAVCWYVSGNIDPRRDCKFVHPRYKGEVPHLVMDGTRKTVEVDGFKRLWPNPVVSSLVTIVKIDELWPSLALGPFITSPSHNYSPLKRGEGAVSD
jgi:4-hydroxy-3-polyprenylbenzoate decarboxylase